MEEEDPRNPVQEFIYGENADCQADGRAVVSEILDIITKDNYTLGRMVKWKQWKYFAYSGFEGQGYLFNCQEDVEELHNVATEQRKVVQYMEKILSEYPAAETVYEHQYWQNRNLEIMRQCDFDIAERWRCPLEACAPLQEYVCTKLPERLPKWLRVLIEMIP